MIYLSNHTALKVLNFFFSLKLIECRIEDIEEHFKDKREAFQHNIYIENILLLQDATIVIVLKYIF